MVTLPLCDNIALLSDEFAFAPVCAASAATGRLIRWILGLFAFSTESVSQ